MTFVIIITLIIVGALCASEYLEQKAPQARPLIDYLRTYKGWIGLVSMALGLFSLIRVLFYIGSWLRYAPVHGLIAVFSYLLLIVLGVILAQEMIKRFMGSNDAVMNVNKKILTQFSAMTDRLGLTAIVTGLVNLLLWIT